jgi:integrase
MRGLVVDMSAQLLGRLERLVLRHTYATLLLAKCAPITYVAKQLGHAKPTTTFQWYAYWLPDAGPATSMPTATATTRSRPPAVPAKNA